METQPTILRLESVSESIYAGFWIRLGAMFLDGFFLWPLTSLVSYLNGKGIDMYYYTVVPMFLFGLWYNIYLPRRYGGTPGKLAAGISIIRLDGAAIAWKEAALRYLVTLVFVVMTICLTIYCLGKADEETYVGIGWMKRTAYLVTFAPLLFKITTWSQSLWEFSELIVLLTNPRKRALQDFMAGTVVVKAIYADKIREEMKPSEIEE
ncbi:MAG: RDD family protein [Prolixibacteraceae bacterium]